ncbi:hypothetical protein Tcan_06826 [Toxocara canis]|uniref:Uncharacterized protein n=1 Tax=Toxocara canis TaxID=6265 RepID=A0A0B2VJQ5_TOXCA|nr:hypothetical protein Tcan_06826 [Toxocara canis]
MSDEAFKLSVFAVLSVLILGLCSQQKECNSCVQFRSDSASQDTAMQYAFWRKPANSIQFDCKHAVDNTYYVLKQERKAMTMRTMATDSKTANQKTASINEQQFVQMRRRL